MPSNAIPHENLCVLILLLYVAAAFAETICALREPDCLQMAVRQLICYLITRNTICTDRFHFSLYKTFRTRFFSVNYVKIRRDAKRHRWAQMAGI